MSISGRRSASRWANGVAPTPPAPDGAWIPKGQQSGLPGARGWHVHVCYVSCTMYVVHTGLVARRHAMLSASIGCRSRPRARLPLAARPLPRKHVVAHPARCTCANQTLSPHPHPPSTHPPTSTHATHPHPSTHPLISPDRCCLILLRATCCLLPPATATQAHRGRRPALRRPRTPTPPLTTPVPPGFAP